MNAATAPDLADKVAIVTGASQGIGQGIALCLAQCGARVTLAARNTARLQETAGQVQAAGGTACVVATDVTRAEQVQAMVDTTLEQFGRIDVLVNNAAIMLQRRLASRTGQQSDQRLSVLPAGGSLFCCATARQNY
jgi:NAD(P)-dependent dehydrogenase (short-subunit alcohol dehydrogenase family)